VVRRSRAKDWTLEIARIVAREKEVKRIWIETPDMDVHYRQSGK
jgi:hypothetical protein